MNCLTIVELQARTDRELSGLFGPVSAATVCAA